MPVQIAAVNVNMPAPAIIVVAVIMMPVFAVMSAVAIVVATTIVVFAAIAIVVATIVIFKPVAIAAVATVAVLFGQSHPVDTVYFKRSVIVHLQAFSAVIANFKRIEIAELALAATDAVAVV